MRMFLKYPKTAAAKATATIASALIVAGSLAACSSGASPQKGSTSGRTATFSTSPKPAPTPTPTSGAAAGPLPEDAIPEVDPENANQRVENFTFAPGWVSDGRLFFNEGNGTNGRGEFFVPGFGKTNLNASRLVGDERVESNRVWPLMRNNKVLGVAYIEVKPANSTSTSRDEETSASEVTKNIASIVVFDPETDKIISRNDVKLELPPQPQPTGRDDVRESSSLGTTQFFVGGDGQAVIVNGEQSAIFSVNVDTGATVWQSTGTVLGRDQGTLVLHRAAGDDTCDGVVGVNLTTGKETLNVTGAKWGVADACETISAEFQRFAPQYNAKQFTGGGVLKINVNGLQPSAKYVRVADGASVKGPLDVPWYAYDPATGFAMHEGQSVPTPKPYGVFNTADQADIFGLPYENYREFGVRGHAIFDGVWFLSTTKGSPVVDLKSRAIIASRGPGGREAEYPVARVGDVTCLNTGTCYVNFDVRKWVTDKSDKFDPKDTEYLMAPIEKPTKKR